MSDLGKEIDGWIKNNTLIRLTIVLSKMGKKTMVGRILQQNLQEQSFLFYCDDDKKVHNIAFGEIEDLETVDHVSKPLSANTEGESEKKSDESIAFNSLDQPIYKEIVHLIGQLKSADVEILLPIVRRMSESK